MRICSESFPRSNRRNCRKPCRRIPPRARRFVAEHLHRDRPAPLGPQRSQPPWRPASSVRPKQAPAAASRAAWLWRPSSWSPLVQSPSSTSLAKVSSPLARVASGNVLVDGQPGDRIAEGSTLSVTGPAPAVIDLSDGSRATLDPATQLTLRGRVDSTRQVLHLTAGGGQFQVPYGGGQFRIDTPAGSVTVLGTQFTAVLRSPPQSLPLGRGRDRPIRRRGQVIHPPHWRKPHVRPGA